MTGAEFIQDSEEKFFSPSEGDTFARLLDFLKEYEGIDEKGVNIIRSNAIKILSKCLHPSLNVHEIAREGRTNVHIADVQSGKTLTMCAVLALAYDNGFYLTTILTGTKNILKKQSIDRIQETLSAIDPTNEKFFVVTNLKDQDQIPTRLSELTRKKRFAAHKMLIFTLLKEPGAISKLAAYFKESGVKDYETPSLMMDDEADQASPNTNVAEGQGSGASSTYRAIRELRRQHSACHTFVQVTATAQGLFCIPEDDFLSPEYVTLSEKNENYIGIEKFFGSKHDQEAFIRKIPEEDILKPNIEATPPQSLIQAVDYFIVAVSVLRMLGDVKPLSMLCHPHSRQSEHKRYKGWIEERLRFFKNLIDEGYEEDVFEGLRPWFEECGRSMPDAATIDFEELKRHIGKTIESTINVTIINTSHTIDSLDAFWRERTHILVGGASIERGFTVVGILVTYLCRSPGMNSDTIQQRARFCGYKSANHFRASRLWLDEENIEFFRHYIVTEKSVRNRIAEHINERKPFLRSGFAITMLKGYRPTRPNIHRTLNTGSFSEWFSPGYSYFLEQHENLDNIKILTNILKRHADQFKRDPSGARKRCFEFNDLTIGDLKDLLREYKTTLTNTAQRELLLSVLESFPEDYENKKKIYACWLCDTGALRYESLGHYLREQKVDSNLGDFPKDLVQKRTLKKTSSHENTSSESDDLYAYSLNLRRGFTKDYKWCSDNEIVDPARVTVQFSFFNFEFDERSFGEISNYKSYEIALKSFNPGLAGVIQVKLPEVGRWTAFSQ